MPAGFRPRPADLDPVYVLGRSTLPAPGPAGGKSRGKQQKQNEKSVKNPVTGYLLVLHLLVVQALVPLPCGQMLVGQNLVVTIACEVICLQFSLLVSNMLVAVICL